MYHACLQQVLYLAESCPLFCLTCSITFIKITCRGLNNLSSRMDWMYPLLWHKFLILRKHVSWGSGSVLCYKQPKFQYLQCTPRWKPWLPATEMTHRAHPTYMQTCLTWVTRLLPHMPNAINLPLLLQESGVIVTWTPYPRVSGKFELSPYFLSPWQGYGATGPSRDLNILT